MMKAVLALTAILLTSAGAVHAQSHGGHGNHGATAHSSDGDVAAVRRAALDYIESIYEMDPAKAERSVHPDMAKRGFFKPANGNVYGNQLNMTFPQLIELAKNYNKNGRVPQGAPKDVVIYEVADQTASAKVIASWGIDYLHLAKYDGTWKIINVLWQTPPERVAR
jgi:hypothetical protein